jgi:hypothetical protein
MRHSVRHACQNTVWNLELTSADANANQKDNEEIEKYQYVLDEMNHKKNIKDAEAKVKSLELKQSAAKVHKKEFPDAQKKELEDAKKELLEAKIGSVKWFKEGKNRQPPAK